MNHTTLVLVSALTAAATLLIDTMAVPPALAYIISRDVAPIGGVFGPIAINGICVQAINCGTSEKPLNFKECTTIGNDFVFDITFLGIILTRDGTVHSGHVACLQEEQQSTIQHSSAFNAKDSTPFRLPMPFP